MPDRRISVSEPAALAAEKTQLTKKKGPRKAIISSVQFLPAEDRRRIYEVYMEGAEDVSLELLASRTRIHRRALQTLIKSGRDAEVGKLRAENARLRSLLIPGRVA